jgi:hypothetical protein
MKHVVINFVVSLVLVGWLAVGLLPPGQRWPGPGAR